MKPLFSLSHIVFSLMITISCMAQHSYLGGGVITGTSLSEKTSPRIGIYFQFQRTLNPRNEILFGASNPNFYSKNEGHLTASLSKIGWRYLFVQNKIYAGLNAGIAFESFLASRYGKDFHLHPLIEINSGYLIPYKNDRIDLGIGYGVFFFKYQNFSWLQLNAGYGFLLKKKKKK